MEKVTVSMSNPFSQNSSLLHVATLGRTIGLKGEMNLNIKTDFPEQFVVGARFVDADNNSIVIETVNLERKRVKLQDVNSPEAARRYVNMKLFTTYEETRKSCHLNEGEFFWFDIIGCRIFEGTQELGSVTSIERLGTVDYLHIATTALLVDQGEVKRFLLPYQQPFILQTDIEQKTIRVSGAYDILQAS